MKKEDIGNVNPIIKDKKYAVVYNAYTGVVHVKHSLFHEELTGCGHNWRDLPAVTTGMAPRKEITCKNCLRSLPKFVVEAVTPKLTVDAIIQIGNQIVMIERKNPPLGYAFPGGFVDVGESCREAVVREVEEETGLYARVVALLGEYSEPKRDNRGHIVSLTYILTAYGIPKAADDAKDAFLIDVGEAMGKVMIADHHQMLEDFYHKYCRIVIK